jgi:hypothetical protein
VKSEGYGKIMVLVFACGQLGRSRIRYGARFDEIKVEMIIGSIPSGPRSVALLSAETGSQVPRDRFARGVPEIFDLGF